MVVFFGIGIFRVFHTAAPWKLFASIEKYSGSSIIAGKKVDSGLLRQVDFVHMLYKQVPPSLFLLERAWALVSVPPFWSPVLNEAARAWALVLVPPFSLPAQV